MHLGEYKDIGLTIDYFYLYIFFIQAAINLVLTEGLTTVSLIGGGLICALGMRTKVSTPCMSACEHEKNNNIQCSVA